MNVAVDISVLNACRTGTEEYAEGLIWGLLRLGTPVLGIGRGHQALLPDRPCLGLGPRRRSLWQKWWWETVAILHAVGPEADIVHIPYLTHPPRPFARPSVVTVHDLIPWRLPDQYARRWRDRWYFRQVAKNLDHATALVAISEATRADLDTVFPHLGERSTVIPNGVHPRFFQPPESRLVAEVVRRLALARRPRILYAGGYDPRKNVRTLLQALAAVFAHRDGELVLVGALGLGEVARWVAEAGLGGRVVSTPGLSREELVALYHAADLFVYPSRYEGFGLPPAQALAAGVPVVASRIPAVEEVVGDAGVLVEADDPGAWAEAVVGVLDSRGLAERLVSRGRQRAAEFDWLRVAARYQALYRRLVQS
ncbi:MAG: glycosyltransferase family 4 protein [Firmicutes bacterium]|nr:glycosyltransferase family 4 protein [Alicyclobacillaceae bacterium]MCL6497128.1 glycosyltransferase family 4 protein [Bacillota bacterium]